ncbi:hypothetical protein P175DRAFT_0310764 [Aspergillus ochraceoroseus IBT 24754]|uniref:Uncharacterized protein n=1 Tax=Aspergillus ochraceoroseus IBT 24754 TaxID=1392256 RepID=A0A2T5LTN9_9EURO|nr:uncharacterized protein P175DRAFT_0310764 [Aspergillus ochraceoroseus IBT 24754]PTU19654.1 hypothetical protein P175DRAFT_0310764 [Aspergillus ochraceoroseus IBT 24754]
MKISNTSSVSSRSFNPSSLLTIIRIVIIIFWPLLGCDNNLKLSHLRVPFWPCISPLPSFFIHCMGRLSMYSIARLYPGTYFFLPPPLSLCLSLSLFIFFSYCLIPFLVSSHIIYLSLLSYYHYYYYYYDSLLLFFYTLSTVKLTPPGPVR